MNKHSFEMAFRENKAKLCLCCVAASGDKMSNLGVFEVDLWINGKKYTQPLNMINELNNIFGLDFVQVHKLKYDVNSRQAKFLVQIQMPFQQLNRQFYLP
jgi:hypothetical protein